MDGQCGEADFVTVNGYALHSPEQLDTIIRGLIRLTEPNNSSGHDNFIKHTEEIRTVAALTVQSHWRSEKLPNLLTCTQVDN